jgi:iron-sulfur cluster assembly protein
MEWVLQEIIDMTLTQKAAHVMKQHLANRGSGEGIRVGVRTAGCSGYAYALEYVDAVNSDDTVFKNRGVNIIVDAKSLPYLSGTEVDYVKQELNEGFEFYNPQVKAACGCGESVTFN